MNVHDWSFGRYCDEQRAEFARLRDLASVLGLPRPGLIDLLESALIEGLQELDSLDRSDSFWSGTNQLATVYKLTDRTRAMMEGDPSPRVCWCDLACTVIGARSPVADHAIWRWLPVEGVHPEWLIEASWIEMSESGFFKPLAAVAARLGFAGVFTDHLARLSGSRDERVASWARIELRAASKVAPAEFRKGD